MAIRPYEERDWEGIWTIFRSIAAAGETYVYDRNISEERGREIWLGRSNDAVIIAGEAGVVVGTAKMGANFAGPGSHVAKASFMVSPQHEGQGIGRALAERVLGLATERGFSAMQFNAVVETNFRAVALWQQLGFTIVGTVPAAFAHPRHGDVGLHVMHKSLNTSRNGAAEEGG